MKKVSFFSVIIFAFSFTFTCIQIAEAGPSAGVVVATTPKWDKVPSRAFLKKKVQELYGNAENPVSLFSQNLHAEFSELRKECNRESRCIETWATAEEKADADAFLWRELIDAGIKLGHFEIDDEKVQNPKALSIYMNNKLIIQSLKNHRRINKLEKRVNRLENQVYGPSNTSSKPSKDEVEETCQGAECDLEEGLPVSKVDKGEEKPLKDNRTKKRDKKGSWKDIPS